MSERRRLESSESSAPAGTAGPLGSAAPAGTPRPSAPGDFDLEINVRAIIWTTVGIAAMTVVSALLMWWMNVGLSSYEDHHAAPPLPIESPQAAPPAPRLEVSPAADLDALRREEDRLLGHSGWISREQGTVRLPIDVAIEILASRGLPAPPAAPLTPAGAAVAPGSQVNPGTILLPPGEGVGAIGPPAAAPASQPGTAKPEFIRRPAAPPAVPSPAHPPEHPVVPPPPPPPGGLL
ncbi:MAG TPA: hypothetical protein VHR45_11955 [Thermoanaerobaculia bacterium]|nr:hypothetical protein [Thermoanaerobaculia bacterium]